MTAINTSRKLLATLAAAISLLIIICMMSVPAFAEDATTVADTTAEVTTVADTTAEVTTVAETTASEAATTTSSETTAAVTTAATTTHDHDHDHAGTTAASAADTQSKTRGIINLAVGGVILVILVVLAIVFRKKIPGFARSMKSETGKIVWCPKDQLKKKAIVVIITILALILIIALLDFAFAEGLRLLRGVFHK